PTPKASDSPAEPAVCTMLFSRIVAWRILNHFEKARNNVIDSTAIGTDADTVMPTLSNRYSEEAPKMMPSKVPTTSGPQVNSGTTTSSGTYGLCSGVPPFVTSGPATSEPWVGADMSATPSERARRPRLTLSIHWQVAPAKASPSPSIYNVLSRDVS